VDCLAGSRERVGAMTAGQTLGPGKGRRQEPAWTARIVTLILRAKTDQSKQYEHPSISATPQPCLCQSASTDRIWAISIEVIGEFMRWSTDSISG
jgi:hypothetical protein